MKINVMILVLLLLATSAMAFCPASIQCSIDGAYMSQQGACNYGTGHAVCKFAHQAYDASGPVQHYVWVDCEN